VAAITDLEVSGLLFNCTSPEAITEGLAELVTLTRLPVGAYPNRLSIPADWTLDNEVPIGIRDDLDVATYCRYSEQWTQLGASIIGGCCGIGPEYIEALSRNLAQQG
jgi:S-methylmethionine-dependent homocysteine/selenocysteine methylase